MKLREAKDLLSTINVGWRFPASGYLGSKGISNGEAEALQKPPFEALAREIIQNSIDSRYDVSKPVIVEFKQFKLMSGQIPGISEYKRALNNCIELWPHKEDVKKEYGEMLDLFMGFSKEVNCLRISDFNTTGLIGVNSTNRQGNKFLALTKDTGNSEKDDFNAGGSKGLGKNAVFIISKSKMVFYSTVTIKDEKGTIGVGNLISGKVENSDDITSGKGYYAVGYQNNPINECIEFDESYRRESTGTDIYAIGFEHKETWLSEMINSILVSFIVAIYKDNLIVNIDDIVIKKDTLLDIINSNYVDKSNYPQLITTYRILKGGDDVHTYSINTEYGSADLFLLQLRRNESNLATHKCMMVRHPFIKIKDEKLGDAFNIAGLCIIGKNDLGKFLRNLENGDHDRWDVKRKNLPEKQEKAALQLLKSIKNQMIDAVSDLLRLDQRDPLDIAGAADYLPDVSNFGTEVESFEKDKKSQGKEVKISKRKKNKHTEMTSTTNENGEGYQPDIGAIDDDGEGEVTHPEGHNKGSGGKNNPGASLSSKKEGDNIINVARKGVGKLPYKFVVLNEKEGSYLVEFKSPEAYDNCYISLYAFEYGSIASDVVEILDMSINNAHIDNNSKIKNEYGPFSISSNKRTILSLKVNRKTLFSSEVKINYEIRK